MLKLVDNKVYIISVNSRLIFNEKINYISQVLDKTKTDFIDNEEELESKFWLEHSILDQTDLSHADYEFYIELLDTFKNNHKYLPQILYKSLVVSIYSIIETTLQELINSTENSINKKIKYKHLKNNGNEIENSLSFFNLLHDLDFSNSEKLLNDLKNYADIRNNFVHYNGSLKEDNLGRKNRIKKFIKNDKTIEIEPNGDILINDCDFVVKFLKLAESFGYELFNNFEIKIIPDK